MGGKAYNFENNVAKEAAFEKLRKRSRDSAALAGLIYIGLNNNVNRYGRKFFWSYRDESSNTQQNVLLASTFSEAILLDEMVIINYKISSKDIMQIYPNFQFINPVFAIKSQPNKSYFLLQKTFKQK